MGRSIGGVKLRMTESGVRSKLGRPDRSLGSRRSFRALFYGRKGFVIYLTRGRVDTITTTSRRQRTGHGLGVGSTERTLRRRERITRCHRFGRGRECDVGSHHRGRRLTTFTISKRRVRRITLTISS